MAGLTNFIYFILTLTIFGGAIALILFVVNKVSEFTSTTKEKLKSQGYSISHKGVQVRTQKRFDHEAYVDATQRGFVKALGASSFGNTNGNKSGSASNKLETPEPTLKKSHSGILRRKPDQR